MERGVVTSDLYIKVEYVIIMVLLSAGFVKVLPHERSHG